MASRGKQIREQELAKRQVIALPPGTKIVSDTPAEPKARSSGTGRQQSKKQPKEKPDPSNSPPSGDAPPE